MITNDDAAHEIPNVTIALTISPYRISDQDAAKLHELLAELAPTARDPYYPGGGPNLRADILILIQFIVDHAASKAIEALAERGVLLLVKQIVNQIQTLYQHSTGDKQQAPTTSIVLSNVPISEQNVTISISTQALLPEQLGQVPDWLAALPHHLSQPPLAQHTVEQVTVPVGYFGVPTEYEDTTDPDPLRYCTMQGPSIPSGIAVFDTHTRTLIDVWAEHRVALQREPSRPTVMSILKRLWRSR